MQKNFFIFSCEAFFLVWLLHVGRGLVQQPYDRKTRHTSPDDDCDDGDDDGGDDDCDDGDGDTLYYAGKVHYNMIARCSTTINVFSFLRVRTEKAFYLQIGVITTWWPSVSLQVFDWASVYRAANENDINLVLLLFIAFSVKTFHAKYNNLVL